jgi:polynucleotide 5'-kinase involved in rRNA processing
MSGGADITGNPSKFALSLAPEVRTIIKNRMDQLLLDELSGKDLNDLSSKDILTLRRSYQRFRVLVIGPGNSGKTTLLERLSYSSAGQAIVTRSGRRVRYQTFRPVSELGS